MPKNTQKQNLGVRENMGSKIGSANKIATGSMEPKFKQNSGAEASGLTQKEKIPMSEVMMGSNKVTDKK